MQRTTHGDLDILPAPPQDRRAALELVLEEVPAERRAGHINWLLEAARSGQVDLDGLLIARHGAEIVGAIWAYLQPGHVATVWPPVAHGVQRESALDALLAETNTWLARGGTRLAQALLAVDAASTATRLARHGFAHLADLLYMVGLRAQFPPTSPESPLRFVAAPATDAARLPKLVERTYERTLDCPQLNGVRDIHDVLAGYRASGSFDPARWLIAQRDEQDVGCLLLTDHPDDDQWEIVYAGLVPEARGRRYGLAITRHAQWLAREAGRGRLALAVDATNVPAVKMYEAAGFVVWDRRQALLQIFPRGGVVTSAARTEICDASAENSTTKCQ